MTQPGDLDQRVEFQRKVSTPDGGGGSIDTWEPLYGRWAAVRPISGRERDMADQTESPRDYRIVVRNDAETRSVLESDRIVWGDTEMQIRFIEYAGVRPQFLTFECESGVTT